MVSIIPLEPNMTESRWTFYIYCLSLYWVWSNLVTLVEKLIMLSRSRSRTLHIYISAAPTLGVFNNMFFIHPKMFYSYTRNRHKNMIVRINAPSSCKCLSWKVSITEEEAWAMQKLFIKERKVLKKMDKCSRYLK